MTRVTVLGTGLIGGSVGLALRRAGTEVRAFDRDAERAAAAKELGIADSVAATVAEAVRGADLTVVAVPVATWPRWSSRRSTPARCS